ncbi:Conserved_hypothetical protein [Hexamita inflata]|uniref:Uncharacterized protein n=1 Tax=Hexamita inflata TaxID=28002 RepID=A0AA86QD33_9EUKA|nr:Conserved hypothetical protein [Hexamita inflata]
MLLFSLVFPSRLFQVVGATAVLRSQFSQQDAQVCVRALQMSSQQLVYCEKSELLSARTLSLNLSAAPPSSAHYSMYTSKVQDLVANFTFSHQNLPSFSLFGVSTQITILDSNLVVEIQNAAAQASLVCFSCDVSLLTSSLTFSCSAFNVSGVVMSPVSSFVMNRTSFQGRLLGSAFSGGLVLNVSNQAVQIEQCEINSYLGGTCGYFAGIVLEASSVTVTTTKMCSSSSAVAGSGTNILTLAGAFEMRCDLCAALFYVYGLCADQLQFGETKDRNISCVAGFVFDGDRCACGEGQVLNGSACVDVLQITSQMIQKQSELELAAGPIDQRIFNNISALNANITTNLTAVNVTLDSITSQFAQFRQTVIDQNLIIQQQQETIQSLSQFNNIFNLSTINMTTLNITASNAVIDNIYNKSIIDSLVQQNVTQVINSFKLRGIGEISQSFIYKGQTYVSQHQTYVLCSGGPTLGVYPNLYAMGLTNIPNMNDSYLKGTANQAQSNDQNYYNANYITLTVDQLPAHTHTSRGYSGEDIYGGWEITGEGTAYDYATSSTGGGQSVNIEPRHKVVYYYIIVD